MDGSNAKEMVVELQALVKVALFISGSMTYARYISSATKAGPVRLLVLLPVIFLLPFLPFCFSSLHLRGISAFFLVWLALFKLLLLAFGSAGPLNPLLPLPTFIAVSSLPVNIAVTTSSSRPVMIILPFCLRLILLLFIMSNYEHHRHKLPRYALLSVYCAHIYLEGELVLTLAGSPARTLLGLEIEPQFNAPFKSTSLQDFWGRRWNLMVTRVLRPSVFAPVRARLGYAWGVMAVFVVSGLMHEVMFYYLTLEGPTGEVTAFFLIHGLALLLEGRGRKKGWWRPPPLLGTVATLGFVAGTAFWLFFPSILRGGAEEETITECEAMWRFVRQSFRGVIGW